MQLLKNLWLHLLKESIYKENFTSTERLKTSIF